MDSELDQQEPFDLNSKPSDSAILDSIEDIIVNSYSIEDEPFSIDELRIILDLIVEVVGHRGVK